MEREQLQDAIGQVDDSLTAETDRILRKGVRKLPVWTRLVAAAAAICLVAGGVLFWGKTKPGPGQEAVVLAQPIYPERAARPIEEDYVKQDGSFDNDGYDEAYDPWAEEAFKRRQLQPEPDQALLNFTDKLSRQILAEDDGENHLYSPLNIYLCLAMLAETTGGETREEILSALEVDTIEDLRTKAANMWEAQYIDDGVSISKLASSIWLDDSLQIRPETMKLLADIYMASAFQGDLPSEQMSEKLRSWLNEQTGGLLEESIKGVGFDQETVMALSTTILFKDDWQNEFYEGSTKPGVFHSPDGDREVDFMSEKNLNQYYWGDSFSAIGRSLSSSGRMMFILPDEGVEVTSLLSDPQVKSLLGSSISRPYPQQKDLMVNLKVPKFDIASGNISLAEALEQLGIRRAFTTGMADFSPMTAEDEGLFVSDVLHSARVMIDEKGVTGAAFTLMLCGASMPTGEEIDLVFDRPFLFVVQGTGNMPLFVGIVNRP